jgi:hypothetical protein
MNEDYIWNRTGSDPEIERLENALTPLRHKGSAPPELPAKVLKLTTVPPRRLFRFAFRFAVASAAVAVLSVIWLQFPRTDIRVGTDLEKRIGTSPEVAAIQPEPRSEPTSLASARSSEPMLARHRGPIRQTSRPTNVIAVKTKDTTTAASLTAEEKYAYGQLMLALSITSSKLKIVKDALAGADEADTVVVNEKYINKK